MRVAVYQEQEAFTALISGDENGFDYFFNRYYSPLVLYATKITRNHEAARDITSETFIKLWENKESFTDYRKVRFFLYRVVYNAAVDETRRHRTKQQAATIISAGTSLSENSCLEKLIETETYNHLHTLLSKLPTRCRQVFQMFYFQDKAIKEIAEELGISVNTVKSQKQRAIQLLKEGHSFVYLVIAYLIQATSSW